MRSLKSGRQHRRAIAASALAVGGLFGASCSSLGTVGAHVTSTTSAGPAATGVSTTAPRRAAPKRSTSSRNPAPATAPSAHTAPSTPSLAQLQERASEALGLTFKATYRSSVQHLTLNYAQLGGNSAFTSGGTAYYSAGGTNTVCDSTTGAPVCHSGEKPLAGMLSLISPLNALTAIVAVQQAGTPATISNGSGSTLCVAYLLTGQPVKYCLNKQGIVSSITTPYGTFKLAAFTTTVSPSDVSPP